MTTSENMNDIRSPNFQALSEFRNTIKNDLAKGNSEITLANVVINYSWDNFCKSVQTKAMITLSNIPYAKIWLEDKDWFNAESFYAEFQTGYDARFSFSTQDSTLRIESNQRSKMGNFYIVEIREL